MITMGFAKPILMVILAVALAAYGFDCSPMTTSVEAMQCCDSMACSSSAPMGQDCCKTMTAAHVPFLPLFSMQGIAPVSVAVLPISNESAATSFSEGVIASQAKAPPIFAPPASPPLRI
jgi:hypothetical protein